MIKSLWINLPVKNIEKSKAFFAHLGFPSNPQCPYAPDMASLLVGEKKIVVMLFTEAKIEQFAHSKISDATKATEVLLSFDAQSRQEVDEMAKKVTEAGGKIFAEPGESQGWMYGFGFADLDGHRWNMLYIDMEKMPRG